MMIKISKAEPAEYEKVRAFYDALIDEMQRTPFNNIWKRGSYPEDALLKSFIENGELYLMTDGAEIISSIGLNHSLEGYDDVPWMVDAKPEEVLVIHVIGVSPRYLGKRHSEQMIRFAIDKARETGMKAMRLDVLPENVPAKKAYTKSGFRYIATRTLQYGDSGIREFELYELPL